MRVITGQARGHKLNTPEGMNTRPTTDKIKESLFNILAPDLYDCEFLDLFSGSGGIGIEALSRGAKRSVFVEESKLCCDIIEGNLLHTKLYDKSKIYRQDVKSAIFLLETKIEKFDIIFMDPPYEGGFIEPVLEAIVKSKLLKEEGYIVVERATKLPISLHEGLKIIREKEYKTTTMTFLMMEDLKC